MLCAIKRGYDELAQLDLIDSSDIKASGTQPQGCSPISCAVRENKDVIPTKEINTIAHSLAIGNPADGSYAKKTILDCGGYAASPTDNEIIDAIFQLARTEGIFTEPADGTAVAGLKKLVEEGRIDPDERTVVYVTGNGLKSQDTIAKHITMPQVIKHSILSSRNSKLNRRHYKRFIL